MQINDLVYHPCPLDIIEHKITGIRVYEEHMLYEAESTKAVGACGRIKILLIADNKNTIRFVGFIDEHEYANGLQDFVEGEYYTNKVKARLKYYTIQRITAYASLENHRRAYEEAKRSYNIILNLTKDISQEIKNNNE